MPLRYDTEIIGFIRPYQNWFINVKYIVSVKEKYESDKFKKIIGTEIEMANGDKHLIPVNDIESLIKDINNKLREAK